MDAFTSALLERLLATSVQTALLTALVWMLCRFLPRLSPAFQCWLWWLVALQALIGLIAAPVELPLLPQESAAHATTSPIHQPMPEWSQGAASRATTNPSGMTGATLPWNVVLLIIWIVGLVIMTRSTVRDWQLSRKLLQDSTPCTDSRLGQTLMRACETAQLRSVPAVRLTPRIESPMLVGHFTPVLLLPEDASLSTEELDMALAHELSHLRRRDLWWGLAPLLMRHLFFFHPMAHLVVREYEIAREAACDAAVVDADQRSRRAYGRLLLRFGTSTASSAGLAVSSPTFYSLRKRLASLQTTNFLSRPSSIALLATVAVAGVMPLRLVAAVGTAAPTEADAATTSAKAAPADSKHANRSTSAPRAEPASTTRQPAPPSATKHFNATSSSDPVSQTYPPEALEDTNPVSDAAGANKFSAVTRSPANIEVQARFHAYAGRATARQERNLGSNWNRSTVRAAARQKALLEMIPRRLESHAARQGTAYTTPLNLIKMQAELAARAEVLANQQYLFADQQAALATRQAELDSLVRKQNPFDADPGQTPTLP